VAAIAPHSGTLQQFVRTRHRRHPCQCGGNLAQRARRHRAALHDRAHRGGADASSGRQVRSVQSAARHLPPEPRNVQAHAPTAAWPSAERENPRPAQVRRHGHVLNVLPASGLRRSRLAMNDSGRAVDTPAPQHTPLALRAPGPPGPAGVVLDHLRRIAVALVQVAGHVQQPRPLPPDLAAERPLAHPQVRLQFRFDLDQRLVQQLPAAQRGQRRQPA